MCKYLIWCFNDTRVEKRASTEKEALKIFNAAVNSGIYSSVVLRKEERTYGYALKHWDKEN